LPTKDDIRQIFDPSLPFEIKHDISHVNMHLRKSESDFTLVPVRIQ